MDELNISPNANFPQLEKLCMLFLQSNEYHKAMSDARYERIQAIKDFLLAQLSLQMSTTKGEELGEMAIAIQKNYYRYF